MPTEYVSRHVVEPSAPIRPASWSCRTAWNRTSAEAAPSESDLRHRYGLGSGPVVVFPAITHPHKGHRFLLDVMAGAWTDPDLRLVLLGGAGAAADARSIGRSSNAVSNDVSSDRAACPPPIVTA